MESDNELNTEGSQFVTAGEPNLFDLKQLQLWVEHSAFDRMLVRARRDGIAQRLEPQILTCDPL